MIPNATRKNMPMEIPVIDLDVFITGSHDQETVVIPSQECKKVRGTFLRDQIFTMAEPIEQTF